MGKATLLPSMLSERLLKEVLTRRTTFLLALTLSSCVVPNGKCASLRDELEEKGMGKAFGYLTQHMDKEEKRSKAMGDAVRFLTDMDRSYLGQVRPRFGKRSQFTFPLMEEAQMVQQHNPRFKDPYSLVALINQIQMENARKKAEEENEI